MTNYLKVLIIDDEEMVRLTLRAFLEDIGFEVVEAVNGEDGLRVFLRERPDLVFTDLRMPVMDGFAVIETLKRDHPETPVIVVSGAGILDDVIRAVRLGAWDYVTKPIQKLEELEITVRAALERSSLIAENTAYREHLEELVQERTNELKDSEALHRTLFETASDAILILKEGGWIIAANPRALELFGCRIADIRGQSVNILSALRQPNGADSETAFNRYVQQALTGEPQHFEWNHRRFSREFFAVEISLNRLELHGSWYLQAIIHDITERKRYEERLYLEANYDSLTGLPNRYLLTGTLEELLGNSEHDTAGLQLMLLDIDNFKFINDTLGHAVGDNVLIWLSGHLKALCGPGDFLARFVGDEFVIVHTGTQGSLQDTISRIRHVSMEPFRFGETELFITVSIGIVSTPGRDGVTAETLIKNAEAAMFAAKRDGVGACRVYSRELSDKAESMLALESRLRKVLEREELTLHYQPQIDLHNREMTGVEALLRWRPPGGEMVSPGVFIPVLEKTGLILPVGDWVIRQTCRQARTWIDQGLPPLRISVNITAWHFYSGKLVETVVSALNESRLDPSLLCLELTESMMMHDIGETMKTINRLHDLGICISIDDFGTGYSSLSYLTRMPIQELKIDRSFILDLPQGAGSAIIVTTILGMADLLKLGVVAEGVETREQYHFLAGRRCQTLQGFYFSKALPPDDLVSFLKEWRSPADGVTQ